MPDSIASLRPVAPPLSALALALAPSLANRLPLGIAEADTALLGGLRRDALHEAYATAREDAAGALAMALLVAWLNHAQGQASRSGAIIWARELSAPSVPYGPGLAELGIDPAIVTLLLLPDSRAVLRAALDSVRQGGAGTVLIELRGRQPLLDLTASRRLALAAQESGTMVWLVRGDAQPVSSAAQTRWQVGHAPAGTGNRPAFDLTLLRHRGGREGLHIRMEWDRDTASFQPTFDEFTPLSGAVPAVVAGTAGIARGDRAA
jgi:protein ImuA